MESRGLLIIEVICQDPDNRLIMLWVFQRVTDGQETFSRFEILMVYGIQGYLVDWFVPPMVPCLEW